MSEERRKFIKIRGANEHNLKNISLEIPRNELVVLTGLSGSGKSSLAFDTIYAEGQRRYMESLSSYARQFLGQMEKPDVESIEGLSPAISIDQKSTNRNPRSMIISVCSMQGSAHHTVPNAAERSTSRVWIRWWIRSWRCQSERRSSCWLRWSKAGRVSM